MNDSPRSLWAQYGVAIASVLIALTFSLVFRTFFEENPFLLFWGAIAITSWYGGLGPSLLAVALSTLLSSYFLMPPYNAFVLNANTLVRLSLFVLLAGLMSSLQEQRHRTERALRHTTAQLNAILAGVADGITAQKPDGELVYANEAAARIVGYADPKTFKAAPVSEVIKRFEVFDEHGEPFPLEALPGRLALQGMRDPQAIMRFRVVATGEERWSVVKATPIWDDDGSVQMAINLFQDITTLKTMQDQLHTERERLRVTLYAIGDGVITTDKGGSITFMNPVAEKLTGWAEPEAIGTPIKQVFPIIHEQTHEVAENPVERALAQGEIVRLANHTSLITKDGMKIPIEDSGAPIQDANGNIIGAVLVFHDVSARRDAEETLRVNNQTLQALVNSSPLATIVVSMEGVVRLWSPAAERMYGWNAAEVVGLPLRTIPPQEQDSFESAREEVASGEIIIGREGLRRTRSGVTIYVSYSMAPLRDSDGNVTSFILITQDITERKRAEITQRFLAEASSILASSLDYATTLANVAKLATPQIADWCAVDILDENETIRRVAVAHIDPDKVQWAYELQKRYPVDENAPRGVPQVLRSGQSEFYPNISDEILVAAARDPEQLQLMREIGFVSAMVVPLTARGRTFGAITLVSTQDSGRYFDENDFRFAEALGQRAAIAVDNARLYREAQLQRERFHVTLASIGDAVIATDAQGNVTFMNPVAETLTGWPEADAYGKSLDTIFRIVNEETRATVENPVTKVLREGRIVGLANHTLLISRIGQEIPIDDSGAPIWNEQSEITGVVLVFRDITERKQVEQERAALLRHEQAARAAAEEANELKLRFLAMISHELRTPLTSIKGFASTLLAPDVEWQPESQREFVAIMDEEADKLTDLVEQLLDVSRLQAGTLRISPQTRQVTDALNVAMAQLQTITVNHQFLLDVPTDLPPVTMDSQRIAQVVVNLVANAAKFSPPHSRITVAARRQGQTVQIDVSDEGDGIAQKDRAWVFEAFRQAERRGGRQRGAGLGLAICKGLVEAHGGKIWIQDAAASGTTISFTLNIAYEV
jgi:PAS domain S-box-containing protein